MTPDPSTLMAVNASDGTSDAPLNNQALPRRSVTTESAISLIYEVCKEILTKVSIVAAFFGK
jgi:hypothetical protein